MLIVVIIVSPHCLVDVSYFGIQLYLVILVSIISTVHVVIHSP